MLYRGHRESYPSGGRCFTFLCGAYAGQSHSYFVAWIARVNFSYAKRYLYFFLLVRFTCIVSVLPFASILEKCGHIFVEKIVRRACRFFYWLYFGCLCPVLH